MHAVPGCSHALIAGLICLVVCCLQASVSSLRAGPQALMAPPTLAELPLLAACRLKAVSMRRTLCRTDASGCECSPTVRLVSEWPTVPLPGWEAGCRGLAVKSLKLRRALTALLPLLRLLTP